MRRTLLILLVLGVLLGTALGLGIAYRQPLLHIATDWQLKKQTTRIFGAPMEYDSLSYEEGTLTINHPRCNKRSRTSEWILEAEELVVRGDFMPWQNRKFVDISLLRPHLQLRCTPSEEKSPSWKLPKVGNRLPEGEWHVEEGILEVVDPVTESSIALAFEAQGRLGNRRGGRIDLYLPSQPNRPITLQLGRSDETSAAYFAVNETSCAEIAYLAQHIDPTLLGNWKVTQGTVSGEGMVVIPEGSLPYLTGQLAIEDLEATHLPTNAQCILPLTTVTLERDLADADRTLSGSLLSGLVQGTLGKLEIQGDGSLITKPKQLSEWSLHKIQGAVDLQSHRITLDLAAALQYGETQCSFDAKGRLQLGRPLDGELTFRWLSPDKQSSSRVSLSEDGRGYQLLTVDLENVREEQAVLLQAIAADLLPKNQDLELSSGALSGRFDLLFDGSHVREVAFSRLEATETVFSSEKWQLSGKITAAKGRFRARVTEEGRFGDLFSELSLTGGAISFPDDDGNQLCLEDVGAELFLSGGRLQKAYLKGTLDDLKGSLEMDRDLGHEGVTVRLEGEIGHVASMLPKSVMEPLQRGFSEDRFSAQAHIIPEDDWFEIIGLCRVQAASGQEDLLPFGLTLQHAKSDDSGVEPHASIGLWAEFGLAFADAWASGGVPNKASFGNPAQSVRIEGGWLQGENLDASKYALPFIRRPKLNSFTGSLDVEARFDPKELTIQYQGRDIEMDSKDFTVTLPTIGNLHPEAAEKERAVHIISFTDGKEQGIVPIHNGTYLEKKRSLLFTDSSCLVELGGRHMEVKQITTTCEGVQMEGSITVNDRGRKGGVDLIIRAPKMEGPLSGAQQIMEHIYPLKLWDVPLEGQAHAFGDGLYLAFYIHQKDRPNEGQVQLQIEEGGWRNKEIDLGVERFCAQLTYDQLKREVRLEKICGQYHQQGYTYALVSEGIRAKNFPKGGVTFDIGLMEGNEEFARLIGHTERTEDDCVVCHLNDRKSHLGNIRPHLKRCVLDGKYKPLSIRAEPDLDLATAGKDLGLLASLKLGHLPEELFSQFLGESPRGRLTSEICYEQEGGLWSVWARGKELSVKKGTLGIFELAGKGCGEEWTIDHLLVDNLSGQLSAHREEAAWQISSLRLQYANIAAIHLSGRLDLKHSHFHGEMQQLWANLNSLNRWEKWQKTLGHLDTKGQLRGSGAVDLHFASGTKWGCSGKVKTALSLSQAFIGDIAIQPMRELEIELLPNGQICIAGFDAVLTSTSRQQRQRFYRAGEAVRLTTKSVTANFDNGQWALDDLGFTLPINQLGWVAQAVQKASKEKISASTVATLAQLKKEGCLQGRLHASSQEEGVALTLALADDTYTVAGKPFPLNDAVLSSAQDTIEVHARTKLYDKNLWLTLLADPTQRGEGTLIISEQPEFAETVPLTVSWHQNLQGKRVIDRIDGALSGVFVQLTRAGEGGDVLNFVGSIAITDTQATTLLPPGVRSFLETAKTGDGYQLTGRFSIPRNEPSQFSFNGSLTGSQFIFRGYELGQLEAMVAVSQEAIRVRNLTVQDPAGQIQIDRITGRKDSSGEWTFDVPSVKFTNLQPNQLHARGQRPKRKKPLVITRGEITHLKGGKDLTLWTGKGYIGFTTQARTNPDGMLIIIPENLQNRPNMDSGSLAPARGTIHFSIRDNRIYLHRLLDTYSSGKRSQFFLAQGQGPNFIDFDGNLNIKLRMKQRNLILKLTQPFTLHVRGTVKKPQYSLRSTPSSTARSR